MSLYGVLTDIHGDIESLKAVENDMRREGVERIVSLGDMVDRGDYPEEVVQWVRANAHVAIRGNHEEMEGFPELATRAKLSADSMMWICSLSKFETEENLRFVHGCPPDFDWIRIDRQTDQTLKQVMERIDETRSFVGHSHRSFLYRLTPGATIERIVVDNQPVSLDPLSRYIVNVGSVYRRKQYAIFDSESDTIRIRFEEDVLQD